jgi:F420-non-reducing hydrogenase iron-sulfur subunit
MTTLAPEQTGAPDKAFVPRILVFSTNNISDPGIDLAGSSHMSYSPGVVVISMPCTSGIRPSWIQHAIRQGFDGVFIASDGDECAYLSDCSERASRIMAQAQALLTADGYQQGRLRMAAICSVCAEPFTRHVTQFSAALIDLGPSTARPAAAADTGQAAVLAGGIAS